MKAEEGYQGTTKLCSSYAWDTAISFIQKTTSNYGTISSQGNYLDTTFNYKDITGTNQTKTANSKVVALTGETVPAGNIYDMGGNNWEWTTESCGFGPSTVRGGGYYNNCSDYPAGARGGDISNDSCDGVDFRPALYM